MTRDPEKCPLSVLTGVRIKRVNSIENISAFCRDKRNCPYKAGVRIKRVSVERGSTVVKYTRRKGQCPEIQNSMFRTPVDCFLPDF